MGQVFQQEQEQPETMEVIQLLIAILRSAAVEVVTLILALQVMEALEAEDLVGMHTLQVPVHQVKDTQEVQDIGRPPETIEFLVEGAELLKSVNLEIILELYTVMEEMEYKII